MGFIGVAVCRYETEKFYLVDRLIEIVLRVLFLVVLDYLYTVVLVVLQVDHLDGLRELGLA